MRQLLQEMIHYRNGALDTDFDAEKVADFKKRYSEILEKARIEYEYEPPSKYYRNGYNLYKRMLEYADSHLLFLQDIQVEPDNNVAERHARVYKRKQKQVMTMRNFDSFTYLCNALTMTESLRKKQENLFLGISERFGVVESAT